MGLRIPDGWRIEKLGDVTSYAQEKVDNSQIDTTRYISTDNMIPNRGGILVSSKKPNESKINSYLKGDILVSNIRPYFKKIWMAKFSGGCSNDVLVIRSNSNVNADFIYYYLSQEDFFDYTVRTSKGTKMPRGDKEAIMNFLVNVPPLSEQQAIAKILSDLDEKIELNNKMNKTLENIAQAIFKRWFIDFEFPNENGDPYKSSGGEMVESELGMIPKGWEIVSLSNIADFLNGLPLQNYRPREDEECLPVIKIRELRNGFTDSTERCTSNIPKSYIAENGDVIFSWSGSLEVVIWSYGKGAINQHLFKVSSEKYPKWFYYFWLLRFLPEFRKIAEDKATTMGHIQRHHLNESLLPVPPQELMDKFGKPIESEFEEAITLRIQSMTLSNLRDILLPKLMTGRIRVPLED